MRGTERVRFCDSCQKNVFNISALTRRDAEALIAGASERICLRLYRRADGTILTEDCPVGLAAVRKRAVRFATAVLSSTLSFASVAVAQVQQAPTSEASRLSISQPVPQVTGKLLGTVNDSSGAVISGAIVICRNLRTGDKITIKTDDKGQFQAETLPIGTYEIATEAPGFTTCRRNVSISQLKTARVDVALNVGTTGGFEPMHKRNLLSAIFHR